MLLASKLKQACWDLACGGTVIPTQRETEGGELQIQSKQVVMVHTFTQHREAEVGISLLEPRLVYIVSSTIARATQKILCLKNKNKFKVSLGYKVS